MDRGFISTAQRDVDDHGEEEEEVAVIRWGLTTKFQLSTVFDWESVAVAKYDNYLLIVGFCVPYYYHQQSSNFPAPNPLIDQIPGRWMER